VFGRIEGTIDTNNSYRSLFPGFVENRILAGLRYEIYQQHALTLEVARVTVNDDAFAQISIQWSALFE
jgi:hypothetical protein